MRLKNTADNFSASFHITPPYQMVVIHSSKLIYPRELYQRGIQRKRVELIAKDFNEYTANEPKVSFRNGRYYVTDGQHTIEARILRNGGKDLPILCKIYTGLTMQQEALFFAEQNGHAAPLTAGIKLRAKVVGEDAPSVAFLAATNRVGLDFNYDSLQLSDYRISCVGTALKLYNQMGEKIYCEALRLIVAAWEGKPDSFRASVLRGMMHFVELYHGEFSEERLIRALRSVHPMEIYRSGMDNARKGKFDILLVFMFDRIGRRAEETPFVVEWLINHGIQVWSVNEGEQRIDTHVDRLTNYIRFWQADGESQKTSMRTKAALGQMVQEGRFRGGSAPYGYDLVPSGTYNKRKHEVFKLEINPDEAKVVRMMFDLCVGSGYGRFKIANFLSEMGIKTRDGKNWHEATVGHILHNIMYTGVLRSGSTQSKAFPDLQIISPENFELAQKLMAERANECNALRTMPRNTRGQSLLSGNVFCGHCGGRLTLTTNGTTRINAAGEKVGRKRIRYVCYNKTRKRSNCDGQTGYTMHILDKMVTDILHQVFDRMRSVEENEIISRTHRSAMVSLKKRLADAKAESAKAAKEYESLKLEIIKAVQGESAFPMDVLSELVNNARTRMLDANAQLTELNEEVEKSNQRIEAIKADYRRIMEWSEMFDGSDMDVKKMIAGYIIKRVDVYSDYRLHIEFNMSFAQFELGLETEVEYAAQDIVS